MKPQRLLLLPIAAALSFTLAGCATSAADQHEAHHPNGSASGQAKMGTMPGSMPMAGMDSNRMEMCKNMMSAKTPEERRAVMDAHMKSMSPEMREQCMEMMQNQMGNHPMSK